MLLAIDIGNTNISLGVFKGKRLLRRYCLSTRDKAKYNYLKCILNKNKIDDAIICSVVPESTLVLADVLTKALGKKPKIIGKGFTVPVKNLYNKPGQVGQDRLVNAYAGVMLYGPPLIIVDFGTAITFDVISKHKEYLGGMILPGLQLSLDVLAGRTALLPKVKLANPKEFIGKDTKSSMLSGIVYGAASLVDDLSAKIKNVIGKNAKVIGTGGNIALIKNYSGLKILDKDLTLKGLNLIYRKKALSLNE